MQKLNGSGGVGLVLVTVAGSSGSPPRSSCMAAAASVEVPCPLYAHAQTRRGGAWGGGVIGIGEIDRWVLIAKDDHRHCHHVPFDHYPWRTPIPTHQRRRLQCVVLGMGIIIFLLQLPQFRGDCRGNRCCGSGLRTHAEEGKRRGYLNTTDKTRDLTTTDKTRDLNTTDKTCTNKILTDATPPSVPTHRFIPHSTTDDAALLAAIAVAGGVVHTRVAHAANVAGVAGLRDERQTEGTSVI
jgi:hypothetical protein